MALTEPATDLRRLRRSRRPTPKTVSYRTASRRRRARLLHAVAPGTPVKGGVNGPAKFPLFDPIFPLFEHDRPDHGLTARTADRAVLVRLRRFLAGIHVPSQGCKAGALDQLS